MPNKHRIFGLALVALALLLGIIVYQQLPQQMPTHWNIDGQIDGRMAKPLGAFLLPLCALLTLIIFELIVRFSPKGYRVDAFTHVVGIIQNVTIAFLLVIYLTQILIALGYNISMERVVLLGVAGLFLLLGNYMGKLRMNFFIGIRTPWTLANEEVWNRTHRIGGWSFVAGGIAILIAALVSAPIAWLVAIIIATSLVPVAYSFWLYKRLQGFN
ncbi:SdpI family protein [Idiomarina tyrosinivorans]|nr:SdpI family protein [Idiomarina tyrosinivorans]